MHPNAWMLGDLHIHRYLVLEYLNLLTSQESQVFGGSDAEVP